MEALYRQLSVRRYLTPTTEIQDAAMNFREPPGTVVPPAPTTPAGPDARLAAEPDEEILAEERPCGD